MKQAYQDILNEPETNDYNQIDQARDLILTLLDDESFIIVGEARTILAKAAELIA